MIPSSLRPEVESAAERRLFERLRDQTTSEVVGFHSVAWLVPGERGKARQSEADFVLAHPDWGIVAPRALEDVLANSFELRGAARVRAHGCRADAPGTD
jgi:hypothetical protein